jgi:thymidylate synthase ThyX
VIHNVESLDTGAERLYQQGAWTYRLSPCNQQQIRNSLRQLLAETDKKARKIFSKYEDKNAASEQITSGISLFYFEEH